MFAFFNNYIKNVNINGETFKNLFERCFEKKPREFFVVQKQMKCLNVKEKPNEMMVPNFVYIFLSNEHFAQLRSFRRLFNNS